MNGSGPRLALGCIADDFSGGTDVGSTLAREGLDVIQTVGVPRAGLSLPMSDAVVVALKSRTAPASEAVASSIEAVRWLRERGAQQVYFKYCSTFDSREDGNIGPVADAILDELDTPFTIACPAFPETGRTVYRGHLFVGDQLLAESPMAHHPLTPMRDSNLLRLLRRQTARPVGLVPLETVAGGALMVRQAFRALQEDDVGYAVVDAITDTNLRSIASAAADLPLITGASGLARGIPDGLRIKGVLRPPARASAFGVPPGPTVVLAGSASAATRRQIREFARWCTTFAIDPRRLASDPDALDGTLGRAVEAMADGPVLIHAANDPADVAAAQDEFGPERSARIVEDSIGSAARRLVESGVRRLIVAGGETSAAVVQALGIEALRIGPDIEPGVPWCTTLGDPPLAIVLKSGNFGSDGFFLEALKAPR